ncbi:MAG: prephenate dehydrogenase/arogenate dehydrogenase family protein [Ignavibacteriales bacterium]|nr:prephenate dehydrogenase/arogenate dehydrogenase family protein [Ignavibacteriales bacterium]
MREDELLSLPAVFLCVTISAMEEVLLRVRAHVSPGTLVMDTCSVKSYPVMLMEKLLPDPVALLGTHPFFGPDSARNGAAGLPDDTLSRADPRPRACVVGRALRLARPRASPL